MIIAIFIAPMLIGVVIELPVAVALLLCTVATALILGGNDASLTIIVHTLMQSLGSVTMVALPFFILTGETMNRSRLMKYIIAFYDIFIGCVRDGLGYVTILACLMFASLVSSAVAACTALGMILIPMIAGSGYDREETAALTASASLVAPVTPPSVPMAMYGVAAGVSIKSLLVDGIAPAAYLTIIASVVWLPISHKEGAVPNTETVSKPTPRETVKIIPTGLWALPLPVTILVGLHSGYFTATETGMIARVYAILIGLFTYCEIEIGDLMRALAASAKASTVVISLAAAANCAAYFMTASRIPQMMASGFRGPMGRSMFLMFVLICIVVVVSLTMDVVPSTLILTSTMFLLVKAVGIDLVCFGAVFVLINVLGLTSPPVRPVLNVACTTGKVKTDEIILSTVPYFIAQTVLCSLLASVPTPAEAPLRWLGE